MYFCGILYYCQTNTLGPRYGRDQNIEFLHSFDIVVVAVVDL